MNSFLRETAKTLLTEYGDLKAVKVVLPNRRAGLFFSKFMGQLIKKPIWMPEIVTIEDLFYGLAEKRPADKLTLIFELYKVYREVSGTEEGFDRFYFWGEMILRDFNDLDQFLVNAEKLFLNLKEQKVLESDWSFLSPDQVALIQEFWASFQSRDREHQEKFLKFWDLLLPLYRSYKSSLEVAGMAYGGMIYREVATRLDQFTYMDKQHVFVGFNAFTGAEELLVKHFVKHFRAGVYWDLDAYYILDDIQEAGLFFRDYRKDAVLGPTFPESLPEGIRKKNPKIRTYALPLKINQANLVGSLLEEVPEGENWEETVVILPDEQLLFPLLNVLPDRVKEVNVTMGYPVKNTPVYTFLEAILEMQRYTKVEDGQLYFYHKPVKELLSMVYLQSRNPDFATKVINDLNLTNTIYLPQSELVNGGDLFARVFMLFTPENMVEGIMEIIRNLASNIDEESMERTYLLQCYKQMNRVEGVLLQEIKEEVTLEFFIRIFRQLFREIKLPFQGEPLEGLQIMGVLESRNLDFRRVIICNMNEGSFPPNSSINALVPFNLRKAFGMPVQEQNDAIYAYTFYRLLHQAEEVHMLYATAAQQGQVGEKSRYIHQIQHEMQDFSVAGNELPVHVPVGLSEVRPITITKDENILETLQRYTDQAGAGVVPVSFSPSAINTWLDCRLKFYFNYIASIEVPEEVQEDVDPALFGNLVHLSLELLYQGYIKRKGRSVLAAEDIRELEKYVFPSVELAIRRQYHLEENKEMKLTGKLAIARDVLQKYLLGVLKKDGETAPFEIISLEAGRKYKARLSINTDRGNRQVAFGGVIDRVDRVNETIRLIDYKSGADRKDFNGIESLFDRKSKSRNKAAMQTLFYGFLFKANFPNNKVPLKPAIFALREIFQEDFNPYLQVKEGTGKRVEVENYMDYEEDFLRGLSNTIQEIFDPDQPFDQTEDLTKCKYCPFAPICSR